MSNQKNVEVLLVEDNPSDADLAMRAFKKYNLANKLVWVKDGEEALNFIFGDTSNKDAELRNIPRVILLDLKLPKVDGLEVLKSIRADERSRMIPIVMLTSSKQETDVVESYKLGVNSYIVKPVDFKQFIEAIREIGQYWLLVNEPPF